MIDNDEYQQGPLNQTFFQDLSSHLSRNVGDETNDTQTLGASFEESQNTDLEQLAVAEKIDRLARITKHGFSQVPSKFINMKVEVCVTCLRRAR